MEFLDPRLALLAAGTAVVGSERVRKTVGKGVGYAATGVVMVGGPVVRPVADAGRDIVQEARGVASANGKNRAGTRRPTTASSA